MKKAARLIGVVAIAMVLMIAFSGVAAASWLAEYTPEKTAIGFGCTWRSSSSFNTGDVKSYNRNFNAIKSTGDTSTWNGLGLLPATSSKRANAYSKLLATNVQAATTTKVRMTDNPALNYNIDAEGSNEGGMAKGRISAGMSVYVAGDPVLSYEERSSASGLFQFHKEMSYTSKITTP